MIRMFLQRGYYIIFKSDSSALFMFFCLWLIFCLPCIICRIEAFEAILGQHVLANHVDQMSIDDIEQTINRESAAPYTRRQVEFILEVWKKNMFCQVCHIIDKCVGLY